MEEFNTLWDQLAVRGFCDAREGTEYERVSSEWEKYGRMLAIIRHIVRESDRGASVNTPGTLTIELLHAKGAELRAEVERMKKREEQIVKALRNLTDHAPGGDQIRVPRPQEVIYTEALRESFELLRIIDAQKE